ncbi:MAG: LysE family transporter [Candidatus Bathyarchaeia archaeon]
MLFEVALLLLIGFFVGLGGALIPGPLLAYVILDTTRKGKVTGHFVMVGHIIWEAFIIFLMLLGLGGVMLQYKPLIYIIGGITLSLMGALAIKAEVEVKVKDSKVNSSTLGGIFYTAFNPTQPPWWATAGLALLLQGYELLRNMGIVMVTIGHWLADFVYYTLVSCAINKYGRLFRSKRKLVALLLGTFVSALGMYFTITGVMEVLD